MAKRKPIQVPFTKITLNSNKPREVFVRANEMTVVARGHSIKVKLDTLLVGDLPVRNGHAVPPSREPASGARTSDFVRRDEAPVNPSIHGLVALLSRYRLPAHSEPELREAVALILRERGIPFRREVEISERDSIDFVCGTVGIECKVDGSALQLAQQIARVGASPEVMSMLVVVTRERMTAVLRWVPATMVKPVHCLLVKPR